MHNWYYSFIFYIKNTKDIKIVVHMSRSPFKNSDIIALKGIQRELDWGKINRYGENQIGISII